MKKRNSDKRKQLLTALTILTLGGISAASKGLIPKNYKEKAIIAKEQKADEIFVINEYLSTKIEKPKELLQEEIESLLNEQGKRIIENSFKELQSDKIVSFSIKDKENQVLRLVYILDELLTYCECGSDVSLWSESFFEERVQWDSKINLGLNVYQLALGFEHHEIESMETYMKFYKKKIETQEINEKDLYDYNMIRNYFLIWENVEEDRFKKYDRYLTSLLEKQNKSYLEYFIGSKGATYEHLNPFTGYKTIPEKVKIARGTPLDGEVTISLPKKYQEVKFQRNDFILLESEMKIEETKDRINYTIYDDPGYSRIFWIVIPSYNFEIIETKDSTLTRKR